MSWWVCRRVEGSASWPGGCGQGFEGLHEGQPQADQKSVLLAFLTCYTY